MVLGEGRTVQLAASIICLDLLALAAEIHAAEADGVDRWHVDLIDGAYAANLGLPLRLIARLRQVTRLPIDAHLMVCQPERYVEAALSDGATTACVPLSTYSGASASTALWSSARNVQTRLGLMLDEPRPDLDLIERLRPGKLTIMATRPGFVGQPFIPRTFDVLAELRSWRDARSEDTLLEVDGAVGPRTAGALVQAGADVLVLGSTVFGAGPLRAGTIASVRSAIGEARTALPAGASA